jgi:hypothetical protein
METATLIQILIFFSYLFFIYKKFGILDSISDSFYELEKVNTILAPLFTLWTWGIGVPFVLTQTPLLMISGVLMCLVGVIPFFKWGGAVSVMHASAAIGAIVFALAYQLIEHGLWETGVAAIIVSFLLAKVHNKTWWIEVACFVIVIIGVLWIR